MSENLNAWGVDFFHWTLILSQDVDTYAAQSSLSRAPLPQPGNMQRRPPPCIMQKCSSSFGGLFTSIKWASARSSMLGEKILGTNRSFEFIWFSFLESGVYGALKCFLVTWNVRIHLYHFMPFSTILFFTIAMAQLFWVNQGVHVAFKGAKPWWRLWKTIMMP